MPRKGAASYPGTMDESRGERAALVALLRPASRAELGGDAAQVLSRKRP